MVLPREDSNGAVSRDVVTEDCNGAVSRDVVTETTSRDTAPLLSSRGRTTESKGRPSSVEARTLQR